MLPHPAYPPTAPPARVSPLQRQQEGLFQRFGDPAHSDAVGAVDRTVAYDSESGSMNRGTKPSLWTGSMCSRDAEIATSGVLTIGVKWCRRSRRGSRC